MVVRGGLLASLLLFVGSLARGEEPCVLHGRTLDQQGQPIADVSVSTYWNANGITLEDLAKLQKERAGDEKYCAHEGRMEPWGASPTKSDAAGHFSMKMGWRDYKLLAIDKERKRGALIVLDSLGASSGVDAALVPLIRLHGRLRIAATGQRPKWSVVVVNLPESAKLPLGSDLLARCASEKSTFEFALPPGKYNLQVYSASAQGQSHNIDPFWPVTLTADQREFDAGTLELTPARPTKSDLVRQTHPKGTWTGTDPKEHYGQPAPKWHVVDARGISKNAQISDLKGKWVLVYFWGTGCAPCLGKTLPALAEFYEAHKHERDRFEIVAVCDAEAPLKTMADLDRELQPVVQAVWHGKQLPFPVILDNTLETAKNFGIEAMGKKLLFDPDGRLVPGDEQALAKKLRDTAHSPAKPLP